MCGIIGVLGRDEAAGPRLLESLRRLEYRGYDSAGVAVLDGGAIQRTRAEGKLVNLSAELTRTPLAGTLGVGHTRWATHGAPTEKNAHPHQAGGVALVHNGIIENFQDLRDDLSRQGRTFSSDTDTEVVAHLIDAERVAGRGPREAVSAILPRLRGAFAIAAIFEGEDDLMIGARRGSPLVVGVGDGEMFLGSDALAIAPFTDKVIYLEEGDWCVLRRAGFEVYDADNRPVERPIVQVAADAFDVEKGEYAHFMLKEIHEQPDALARTIGLYIDPLAGKTRLPDGVSIDFGAVDGVNLVACGTAFYAGMAAAYWFERIAGLAARTDIASEFRYRDPVLKPGGLSLFTSQSGETADTLAALRHCAAAGQITGGVVNVPTSTIAREADRVLPTRAGPEIGVASTKAFTAQLAVLAALAIHAGRIRGHISAEQETAYVRSLSALPGVVAEALKLEDKIVAIAKTLASARDVIFLGRGAMYPIALEGALKLKEISYIHAEGYASGELKHGPIALIDEKTPVVFVAPMDPLFEKSISNLQEVAARDGRVILITDEAGAEAAGNKPAEILTMPSVDPLLAPIVQAVAMQLLAYHTGVAKGEDVDQPRNLAKAVTVE